MRKIICDMCEKEIGKNHHLILTPKSVRLLASTITYDICERCYYKLIEFIKGYKK